LSERPHGAVIIPAHNEATVIRECLDALFAGVDPHAFQVVVSCNGCTDGTADVVRNLPYPVTVLEQKAASKPRALRLAESACDAFPRLYVDADVTLPGSSAVAVLERLADGVLAARPPVRYDTSSSSTLVRRFHHARGAVPTLHTSLWGAGVYGLSRQGRDRFGAFPDVVGDDLFVDRLFAAHEVEIVDCEPVTVRAPRRTADLVRLLRRSFRGKAEADAVTTSDRSSTGRTLFFVLRHGGQSPGAALDALAYIALVLVSRAQARLRPRVRWERDESSRSPGTLSAADNRAPN
jgi:glycosyltransferase involved in cell wall biosynthesis